MTGPPGSGPRFKLQSGEAQGTDRSDDAQITALDYKRVCVCVWGGEAATELRRLCISLISEENMGHRNH